MPPELTEEEKKRQKRIADLLVRMNTLAKRPPSKEDLEAAEEAVSKGYVSEDKAREISYPAGKPPIYDTEDATRLWAGVSDAIFRELDSLGVRYTSAEFNAISEYVAENLLRVDRPMGDPSSLPNLVYVDENLLEAEVSAGALSVIRSTLADEERAINAFPQYQLVEQRLNPIWAGLFEAERLSPLAYDELRFPKSGGVGAAFLEAMAVLVYFEDPAKIRRTTIEAGNKNADPYQGFQKLAESERDEDIMAGKSLFPIWPSPNEQRRRALDEARLTDKLKNFSEAGKLKNAVDQILGPQTPPITASEKLTNQADQKVRGDLVSALTTQFQQMVKAGKNPDEIAEALWNITNELNESGAIEKARGEARRRFQAEQYSTLGGAGALLKQFGVEESFDAGLWTDETRDRVKREIIRQATAPGADGFPVGDISYFGPELANRAQQYVNERENLEFARMGDKPAQEEIENRLKESGLFSLFPEGFNEQFLKTIVPRLQPIWQDFALNESFNFDLGQRVAEFFTPIGPLPEFLTQAQIDKQAALKSKSDAEYRQEQEALLWAPVEAIPAFRPGLPSDFYIEEDPILMAQRTLKERSIPDRLGVLKPGESLALLDPYMYVRQYSPMPPSPVQDPDPVVREAFQQGFAQRGLTDFPSFEDAISSRTAEILYGPELRFPDIPGMGNTGALLLLNELAGDSPGFFNFLADRLPQLVPQFEKSSRRDLTQAQRAATERTADWFEQETERRRVAGEGPISQGQIASFEQASLGRTARQFDFSDYVRSMAPSIKAEFAQTPVGRNEIEQIRLNQERGEIESRITDPEVLRRVRAAAGESVPQLRYFQDRLPGLAQAFGALPIPPPIVEPSPTRTLTDVFQARYPGEFAAGVEDTIFNVRLQRMEPGRRPFTDEEIREWHPDIASEFDREQAAAGVPALQGPPRTFGEFFGRAIPSLQEDFALTPSGLTEENRRIAQFEQELERARTQELLQDPAALSLLWEASEGSPSQLTALSQYLPTLASEYASTDLPLPMFSEYVASEIPAAVARFGVSPAGLRERVSEIATGLPALRAASEAAAGDIPFLSSLISGLPDIAQQYVAAGEEVSFPEYLATQVPRAREAFAVSPRGIQAQDAMEREQAREEQQLAEIGAFTDPAVRQLMAERAGESVARLRAFTGEIGGFAQKFAEAEERPETFGEFVIPRLGAMEERFAVSPQALSERLSEESRMEREAETEEREAETERGRLLMGGRRRFARVAI